MLSSNIRCDQIDKSKRYDFGHTLLFHLSLTWMCNKSFSALLAKIYTTIEMFVPIKYHFNFQGAIQIFY
jgi:hypothetical protein